MVYPSEKKYPDNAVYQDFDVKEYEAIIPEGFYSTEELEDEMVKRMNLVSRDKGNTSYIPNNFYVNINPHSSITTIVARDQNYYIAGIYSNPRSSTVYSFNIILKNSIQYYYAYLPFVITGVEGFNGFPNELINLIEIYDNSKGTNCKSNNLYYSYIYGLTSKSSDKYTIYHIDIGSESFKNRNDIKLNEPFTLLANQADFVVYDEQLKYDILNDKFNIPDKSNINIWRDLTSIKDPIIAQAYPTAFINTYDIKVKTNLDQDLSCIDKKNSILSILGWDISVYKDVMIDKKQPFKFIHRNIDSKISKKLNVELLEGDKYIFKTIPYVFLKLSFPTLSEDRCSGQMIRSTSNITSKLTNEYFYPIRRNEEDSRAIECPPSLKVCPIDNFAAPITDKFEVLEKDTQHLFAKIKVSSIPGRLIPYPNYEFEHVFYDNPINNVRQIKVEIISPDGRLVELTQEHNITLEIMETIDVLKETLLDTKHNNVVTTGAKELYND